jgi:hypothetical protein
VFGGKAEMIFNAYVLNDDELKKLEEEMKKSEISDVLNLIEGTTTESLGQLEEEINFFLEEKAQDEKKRMSEQSNPFLALLGRYESPEGEKPKSKKESKQGETTVAKDNWIEKNLIRPLVAENIKAQAFDIFDIYKKSHGMVSYT